MHETTTSFFNVEQPTGESQPPSGTCLFRGWVVPKPGHHFSEVRIGVGGRSIPAAFGFPRADLRAHFAPADSHVLAEFAVECPLARHDDTARIEALDATTGRWEQLTSIAVRPSQGVNPSSTAEPWSTEDVLAAFRRRWAGIGGGHRLPYPRVIWAPRPPFHGHLIAPAAFPSAQFGQLRVEGWLLHEGGPIRRIFASTDLLTLQPLVYGGEFPGVADIHPRLARARDCRIVGRVDVLWNVPGPKTLRIFAETDDGELHLCLAVQFSEFDHEQRKLPSTRFTWRRFINTWRDLRTELKRAGVASERTSLTGKLQLARQLKDSAPTSGRQPGAAQAPAGAGRPREILLFTQNLNLEGAPLLFLEYARALHSRTDARITVVSPSDGPLRTAFAGIPAQVELVSTSGLQSARSESGFAEALRAMAKAIDWRKVDLVVANTLQCHWAVHLAALAGKPAILYIHESTSPEAFFGNSASWVRRAARAAIDSALAVSFNTPATSDYYRGLSDGRNFHHQVGWIDARAIARLRNSTDRTALRAELGVTGDDLLVVNVGTVCDRKGQHDHLRAIAWLRKISPELSARCRHVLVGGRDDDYNDQIRRNAAALSPARVAVVRETARALDYFLAADLAVCSSYEESFPRVVMEAMAAGVPLVSTTAQGVPVLLRDGIDGRLVPPGNPFALAEAMTNLLTQPVMAEKLATSAKLRIQDFDSSRILSRHVEWTVRVFNGGLPSPA